MEDSKELFGLIDSVYRPRLEGNAQTSGSQRLVNERELSIQELIQMYNDQVHLQFSPHAQGFACMYIFAKIAYSALNSDPFNGEMAKNYKYYAETVKSNDSNYDPCKEADILIGKISAAMLVTEDLSEMNNLYELMTWVKSLNCLQNFEVYEDLAETRYTYVVDINQTGGDFDRIERQLEGLGRMNELAVPFDFESQKVISVWAGIVSYGEADEGQKARLVNLMKKLNVQSESTKQMIDELASQHPQADSLHPQASLHVPDPVPDPSPKDKGPRIPEENTNRWVYDKSQLQLEQYPFHSNTGNKVKMYIFKGIYPYSETHQFPVAVKEYHATTQEELTTFIETECKILSFLSGKRDYFLVCYGWYLLYHDDRHILGIVMEYCEKNMMELIDERSKHNPPLGEQELYYIVYTLLEGFAFLTQYKIYHYDVKPHNIFLTKDNILKIADFNVSKIFDSELSMTTLPANQTSLQGTDGYMPPEIQQHIDAKKLGENVPPLRYKASKVDVYSLGLTFLQLFTLKSVYGLNRQQNQQTLQKTLDNIEILWFKNLLEHMLVFDYNKRKSMQQLVSYLPNIHGDFSTIKTTMNG